MKIIKQENVLVFADIHQNTSWVDSVLQSETYNHVVFLGDYFDTREEGVSGIKETCEWINKTYLELGDWEEELKKVPQIVGHTVRKWYNDNKPSRKGMSWCIDCAQTYYAILNKNQLIKLKTNG
jgi:hypothetical protein